MAETTGIKLDPKYDDYDFPVRAPVEQNGHPGYLNEMQQAQVEQLRLMLEAEGYTKRLDTLTLVCFLRRRRLLEGRPRRPRDNNGWLLTGSRCSCDSSAPASST